MRCRKTLPLFGLHTSCDTAAANPAADEEKQPANSAGDPQERRKRILTAIKRFMNRNPNSKEKQ